MPAISGMLPKGNHRDKHTRPFTPSYGLPLNKNATNLQVAKRRYPQTPFPCSRGDRGSRGITSERWRLSQDVGIGGSTGEFFATPQESQESLGIAECESVFWGDVHWGRYNLESNLMNHNWRYCGMFFFFYLMDRWGSNL